MTHSLTRPHPRGSHRPISSPPLIISPVPAHRLRQPAEREESAKARKAVSPAALRRHARVVAGLLGLPMARRQWAGLVFPAVRAWAVCWGVDYRLVTHDARGRAPVIRGWAHGGTWVREAEGRWFSGPDACVPKLYAVGESSGSVAGTTLVSTLPDATLALCGSSRGAISLGAPCRPRAKSVRGISSLSRTYSIPSRGIPS